MFSFIFSTERFCAFDYGDGNQDIYGQETPPDYDLTKVTAPVALYWGDNDWLAAQTVSHVHFVCRFLHFSHKRKVALSQRYM